MILGHVIALDPTPHQEEFFAKASGVARFAWNWALAEWERQYAEYQEYRCGPRPSELSLRRELNTLKSRVFPWITEVPKSVPQHAIKCLGRAFHHAIAGHKGHPKFKKKDARKDVFRFDNGSCKETPNAARIEGKRIKIPKLGWVKMREPLRFKGRIMSATVSRVADRWFVSITVDVKGPPVKRENQACGGVDLGIKTLATLSDGTSFEGPKAFRKNLRKLKRMNQTVSRRRRGSANYKKALKRRARLHARITNMRKDAMHKATTEVVHKFGFIGIEDLNVNGMMANRRLSRAIGDVGMFEFRRQLTYKAAMCGSHVLVASRWFPSSKTCYDCGHVHKGLTLADREWTCSECGVLHDRDHNAALNLMKFAASSAVTACGAESTGFIPLDETKLTAVKQEPGSGRTEYYVERTFLSTTDQNT